MQKNNFKKKSKSRKTKVLKDDKLKTAGIDISKEVSEKIKKEKITPTPKWEFLLINYLFWLLAVIITLIGALFFSLIIFTVLDLDWDLHRHSSIGFVRFILSTIPHLWITLFAVFLVLGYVTFKKTKRGYRYNLAIVIASMSLLSVIFGSLAYAAGIDDKFIQYFSFRAPAFNRIAPTPFGQWERPEEGMLGGEVIAINDTAIQLKDFREKDWQVNISPRTDFNPKIQPKVGAKIKVFGQQIDESIFEAFLIRPWEWRPHEFQREIHQKLKKPPLPLHCWRKLFLNFAY